MPKTFHLYQVAVAIVAFAMIYQGTSDFLKGKGHQTLLKLFTRITVWGGMAAIAIFPSITITFAKLIGIEGNINAVVLTGFILVFLVIFKLLSAIERLEGQISELTRRESIKDYLKSKKE